jgi:hypothetical protein
VIIVVAIHIEIPFVSETSLFEADYNSNYLTHIYNVQTRYNEISFINIED